MALQMVQQGLKEAERPWAFGWRVVPNASRHHEAIRFLDLQTEFGGRQTGQEQEARKLGRSKGNGKVPRSRQASHQAVKI